VVRRRDDIVASFVLLKHPPHRVHVIAREAPVAFCVEVAQPEFIGKAHPR
jgi:hypothetical protein